MNLNISKIENLIGVICILLSIIFYFLGFFYREISNGAGHTDLQLHIWPLVNDFNENYVYTLKNYLSYQEATFPFFHTVQAFLNPFKQSYLMYCLSNTIFNLLILYIFFIFIKKKKIFSEKNLDLALIVVFIFLLSPWFRSSSYWGMTENLSIFFLIPSIYYLSKVFEKKDNIKLNIILAIFISLTIYARQQYLFLGLSHAFILLFERNSKKIFYTFLIYFIFSLPGIFVYNLWGVFQNLENATSASSYISIKNIYINFPKISCLIFFYLSPLIILNLQNIKKRLFSNKYLILFLIIFVLQYAFFNKINYSPMGGGYIVKFNKIFFNNNISLLLIISSFFLILLIEFMKDLNKRYLVLLLFIFIVIGLPEYIFQEWFDPIYLIFYYLLLSKDKIVNLGLIKKNVVYFIYAWEFLILLIAISYYHFYLKIPLFYSF